MPRHDYKCPKCNNTEEHYLKMSSFECGEKVFCHKCDIEMERLFPMQGSTHGDEAPWLESTTAFLKEDNDKVIRRDPVRSRTEYKKLLKEKGLVPVG